jgi:prevent-host-death family protein
MNAQGKITATVAGKVTTMTSREFNQHTGKAKIAADKGPVFITDRGKPAYVLLSTADFERLTANQRPRTALETLADPRPEADFEFEFERAKGGFREIDFGEP